MIPHQIARIREAVFESFFLNKAQMEASKRINAEIIQNITHVFVIHGKIAV